MNPMYSTPIMTALEGRDPTIDLVTIGHRVLDWYERHGRDLPWRRTNDPYAIWVAEIMLQQTRVDTVIGYYHRFLAQFPSIEILARAPLDKVLKAWEGLGYYARARNLHAAARRVVQEYNGRLPRTAEELLRLPGIGTYTAAAISSIAFGHDAVALDGNLRRVLCRIFAIDDDPGRPSTQRRLEALGMAILPPSHAGDLNQALMDLANAVCTPANPRCLICPLTELCQAREQGLQNALPIRATRTHRPHRDVTAGVIWDANGQFLITQRPLDSMLGGLWEFPGGKRRPGEDLIDCLRREIIEEIGIEIEIGDLLCTIEHVFTHFYMTLYAYQCRWVRLKPQCLECKDLRWVTVDQLDAFAFAVADQKIIAHLREQGPPGFS